MIVCWFIFVGILLTNNRRECPKRKFKVFVTTITKFPLLNKSLKVFNKNKGELLRVLDYPNIALHNNLSERDIREYVKRRKISGSTRSDEGRDCRDTFASLKKTAKKLQVPFWSYLVDRISKENKIPQLSEMIIATATK